MGNLKGAKQKIILTSQVYASQRNAEEGMASVIANAELTGTCENAHFVSSRCRNCVCETKYISS